MLDKHSTHDNNRAKESTKLIDEEERRRSNEGEKGAVRGWKQDKGGVE